jgi:DNA invertase Pin-like site-specific DNA recombinase
MTHAIGYVRRSSDRQEESLEQQRENLRSFAQSRGWALVTIYEDDAISGSDLNRPGLSDAVDRAKMDETIDLILTWDRNRLARPKDPLDGMLLERQLTNAGKRVVYAGTGQEASSGLADNLLSLVEHYQNGDYLRKLSRDSIRGIVSRVKQGGWPGGPVPFGFDRLLIDEAGRPKRIIRDQGDGSQIALDPESGQQIEQFPKGRRFKKQDHETCTLIPSEDSRVRAVQRLFRDFAAGKPTRRVRDDLNKAGFRTSRGARFTNQTVIPMLENPAYIGQAVYNRRTLSKWHSFTDGQSVERAGEGVEKRPESDWIVTEDAWPALIDRETWDAVQARRRESRESRRSAPGNTFKAGYLLTGMIYCGVCGGKLTGQTRTSGKGYKTRYYVCSSHHNGHKDKCPHRYTVPAETVENHIIELVKADLANLRDDETLHQCIVEELGKLTDNQSDTRHQLEQRLAELDKQLDNLRQNLLALDPPAAQAMGLHEQANELAQERQRIARELEAAQQSSPDLPDAEQIRARAVAAFDELDQALAEGTVEERRELLGLYVQKIEADPDQETVQISLYPALFSRNVAGVGFEPTTSGL